MRFWPEKPTTDYPLSCGLDWVVAACTAAFMLLLLAGIQLPPF